MQTIPLRNLPEYTLDVTLEAVAYKFRVKWNYRGQYYTLEILTVEGDLLIGAMKLALNATLLRRHPGRGLPPGELTVIDSKGETRDITQNDLEERIALVYVTEAELAAL